MTQLRAASKDLKRLEIQFGMDSQTHTHTLIYTHMHTQPEADPEWNINRRQAA